MTYSDEHLTGEIRAGGNRQERAIRQLYEQCFHLARFGKTKYRQLDGDDVVSAYNSAILAVRNQILNGAFRGDSAIQTYLNRIFMNRCIDMLRSKSSNPVELVERMPDTADESQDLLSRWAGEEQVELVKQKLLQLGGVCQQLLMYSEYLGYSAVETAAAIGFKNANSVNSKKYACLQKLREMMGVQ
jgi:RNA polymerase sigma factor (sigma-70 family)